MRIAYKGYQYVVGRLYMKALYRENTVIWR